jgi:hypothetical protein
LPESGDSSQPGQPAATPPPRPAAGDALLSRVELELPDGRYLLAYQHLEPGAAGA